MSTPGYALPTPHLFDQAVDAHEGLLLLSDDRAIQYQQGYLNGLLVACVIQMCDEPYTDDDHGDILRAIRRQVFEASDARRGGGGGR